MSCSCEQKYWDKFVSGDKDCFRKIFEMYYEELYGYGLKLSKRSKIVEDSIQELFEIIWKRRFELNHVESPRVYLFVSLRRKILKKINKQKSNKEKLEDYKPPEIYFSKEELIIKNESKRKQKEQFQEALNQLSDREKEVVYLHFYHGLTYREIEEVLSINRQSVYNYMHRALETLRSYLKLNILPLLIPFLVSFFIYLFW